MFLKLWAGPLREQWKCAEGGLEGIVPGCFFLLNEVGRTNVSSSELPKFVLVMYNTLPSPTKQDSVGWPNGQVSQWYEKKNVQYLHKHDVL